AQALVEALVKLVIGVGNEFRGTVSLPEGEPVQQGLISLLLASRIAGRAASQHFQPAPERVFLFESATVANDSEQGQLKCLLGFRFLASGYDQQEMVKSIEIKLMEFDKGHFFTCGQPLCQQDDTVPGGLTRGSLFHGFGFG